MAPSPSARAGASARIADGSSAARGGVRRDQREPGIDRLADPARAPRRAAARSARSPGRRRSPCRLSRMIASLSSPIVAAEQPVGGIGEAVFVQCPGYSTTPASTASSAAGQSPRPSSCASRKANAARPPIPAPTSGKAQAAVGERLGAACRRRDRDPGEKGGRDGKAVGREFREAVMRRRSPGSRTQAWRSFPLGSAAIRRPSSSTRR